MYELFVSLWELKHSFYVYLSSWSIFWMLDSSQMLRVVIGSFQVLVRIHVHWQLCSWTLFPFAALHEQLLHHGLRCTEVLDGWRTIWAQGWIHLQAFNVLCHIFVVEFTFFHIRQVGSNLHWSCRWGYLRLERFKIVNVGVIFLICRWPWMRLAALRYCQVGSRNVVSAI